MSSVIQALILGILQGLTEFLPVSSSGHLVLAQQWMGDSFVFLEQSVAFDLVLHVGTLLPVLWFYRVDLMAMVKSLFDAPWKHEGGPVAWLRADPARWLAAMVVLATIPTGVMGIVLKDTFESLFHSVPAVCGALFVTGCLLFSTRFAVERDDGGPIEPWKALVLGVAQGLAITPGISRSGTTIAVALFLGLRRADAARMSFLMSIPAICGAVVLVGKDGVTMPEGALIALAVGFLAAMVVGYLALVMLVALVKRGGIHRFAYYLWPVSIVAFFWLG